MYEGFYGYTAKPFRLSPDPRFFFNSKGHKRALAYLRYGVKQGEGFIIVTGDVGTGKTTLVSALVPSLAKENIVTAQVVTTQMQADELLRMVAAGFGLPFNRVGKAALLHSLEHYFRACVDEGKRVLLIVDEAQGLPRKAIEELRMLSNFTYRGRSLLQSFLLGQREFRQTMRSEGFEQLRQRVIAAYHLKPLDADETRDYVRHRLSLVGWTGTNPSLAEDVLERIFEFTSGVPRRVNTLCDRLLLYGYLEELTVLDRTAFDAVAADIVEEQGGGDPGTEPAPILPSPKHRVVTHELSDGEATVAVDDPNRASRLSAVETSVATLTEAVREELALLRKALVERSGRDSEKPDEDERP